MAPAVAPGANTPEGGPVFFNPNNYGNGPPTTRRSKYWGGPGGLGGPHQHLWHLQVGQVGQCFSILVTMEMDPLQHEEANIELPRFFEYFSFSLFFCCENLRICYNFSSSKFSTLVWGIRFFDGLVPAPWTPCFLFLVPPFMKKKDTFLSIWYAVAVCDMKYTFFMNVN